MVEVEVHLELLAAVEVAGLPLGFWTLYQGNGFQQLQLGVRALREEAALGEPGGLHPSALCFRQQVAAAHSLMGPIVPAASVQPAVIYAE